MTYYFFGIPILGFYCVTTTEPPEVHISLLGGDTVAINYNTYQAIRETAGWPDVVCGED